MPYPEQAELIRDLVLTDHVALEAVSVCLAIYFQSRRVPNEECLFEVIHNFGFDEVSQEKTMFQVQFGPTHNFPLPAEDYLHLFLTNPVEAVYAIENGWPEIYDICQAIGAGRYEVIYERPSDLAAQTVLRHLVGFANALTQAAIPA